MKEKKNLIILILLIILLPILLASCNKTNYVISFDSRGGTVIKEAITINATQKKADFPTPQREGFIFDGWYTDIYCTMPATLTNIRQNAELELTLYAKWVGKDNVLRFDAGGGWGSMDAIIVHSGDAVVIPNNTFTNPGYAFAGWASSPNGGVEYLNGTSYTMGIGGEYTLYAIWEFDENYYTLEYFEDRIELLANLFEIENLDLSDCIINSPQDIANFVKELFDDEEISTDYIDFIVESPLGSIVFSLAEQVYTNDFKDWIDIRIQELIEQLDDTLVFLSEARGNLVCLTVGGGQNMLVDEIQKEDGIAYLIGQEQVSLLHFASNKAIFTIPSTFKGKEIVAIESNAFFGNQTLTIVIIPANITYIGSSAFGDNPNLTIKCEVSTAPQNWAQDWNTNESVVIWGYSA